MSQNLHELSDAPYNVDELLHKIAGGWTPEYLCFWGHQAKTGDAAGKHVLSQWWQSEFEAGGIYYPTAEHYMMAEKARMFGDDETLSKILAAPGPGAVKALGRTVKNFAEAEWEIARFDIAVRGNRAKFSQNPALRIYLLNTGANVLVEASPVDTIWGVGLATDDPRVHNPDQWPGINLLGFALMKVRDILRMETRQPGAAE
jgi:ribA/ribD-fused uncharacterized protein